MNKYLFSLLFSFCIGFYSCSNNSTEPTKPTADIDELVRNSGIINNSLSEKEIKTGETMNLPPIYGQKWGINKIESS